MFVYLYIMRVVKYYFLHFVTKFLIINFNWDIKSIKNWIKIKITKTLLSFEQTKTNWLTLTSVYISFCTLSMRNYEKIDGTSNYMVVPSTKLVRDTSGHFGVHKNRPVWEQDDFCFYSFFFDLHKRGDEQSFFDRSNFYGRP